MNTPKAPSLLVRTVISDKGSVGFDRWLEAALDSLATATAEGLLDSWSVVADDERSTVSSPADVRAAEENARYAGGALRFGPTTDQPDAALILLVDGAAILLSSTIERLLRSPAAGLRPVAAREIPLGGVSCVLLPAGAGGALADHAGAEPEDTAAVFRNRGIAGTATVESVVQGGSLLELALPTSPLRDTLAQRLASSTEPLLSVVLRTQGRRPEPLRDALLSLAGQSDGRFEVVVVVHDGDGESVASVVADQPQWLRSRTRVITASGGTRALPLNVGIAAAAGTAVAFLDDDDVVLGGWVAAFHAGALAAPRRVVRSVSGVQRVSRVPWPGGLEGHTVDPAVELPYPPAFDLADHLLVNRTPFMSVAFPMSFFSLFGGADEALEVCEDWDLLLRAASVLGVVQVPMVTAIYRRWSTGGDSYTTHDSAAWDRDMRTVRAKLDAGSIILPPGSATELADLAALRPVRGELLAIYASTSWRLSAPVRWLGKRFRHPKGMV